MLFNLKLFKYISRVRKISKSDYYFRRVCLSVCPSAWNKWALTGLFFMQFYIRALFLKFKFVQNLTRITGIREGLCTFMIISRTIL